MLPLLMAAGAVTGLAKDRYVDQPREKRDRELAAKTALYSPWTGMRPNEIREANAFNSALQGGLAGFQMGQGMEAQNMQNQYMQQMTQPQSIPMQPAQRMGGSPWMSMNQQYA